MDISVTGNIVEIFRYKISCTIIFPKISKFLHLFLVINYSYKLHVKNNEAVGFKSMSKLESLD